MRDIHNYCTYNRSGTKMESTLPELTSSTLIDKTEDFLPYRYYITVNLDRKPTEDKDLERIIIRDFRKLARKNKSHILPIVGYDRWRTIPAHYHSLVLSELPLSFECLRSFHKGKSALHCKDYNHIPLTEDNKSRCIQYVVGKDSSKTHDLLNCALFHPRDGRKPCSGNECHIGIITLKTCKIGCRHQ